MSAIPITCARSESSTNADIHLGMTEQEFATIFGDPTTKTRLNQWKYEWTLEPRYTEAEKKAAASAGHPVPDTHLVGIIVEAKFRNDKLIYFYISKTEST